MSAAQKISVCIITYNQERFIGRCLESVLSQDVPVELEVIVGDDCSTDLTSEIVDGVAAVDDRVRVIRSNENLGPTRTFLRVHNEARGELVCHLDGDDAWFPGKLAAQVALMETSPALRASGHVMSFVDDDGTATGGVFPGIVRSGVSERDVVRLGMPFLMSSLMYRRSARSLTTTEFEIFDWYILTDILAGGGLCACIQRPLGVYTVNPKSLTASLGRREMTRRMMRLYRRLLADRPDLRRDIFSCALFVARGCLVERQPISREHLALLLASFSPSVLLALDADAVWHDSNAAALAR